MKKNLLFLTAVFFVVIGYLIYRNGVFPIDKNSIQQQMMAVYLKVNNKQNFIKYVLLPGKTALDLTKKGAAVMTKGDGINAYITEINGQTALDSKKEYWAFYVNGKMAEVGAGSYKLKNNDRIEWKLENY